MSAPAPTEAANPLAGVTLLIPNGLSEEAAVKGVRLTPKALKRIRIAMAKENVSPEQGGCAASASRAAAAPASATTSASDCGPRERETAPLHLRRLRRQRPHPHLRRPQELHPTSTGMVLGFRRDPHAARASASSTLTPTRVLRLRLQLLLLEPESVSAIRSHFKRKQEEASSRPKR